MLMGEDDLATVSLGVPGHAAARAAERAGGIISAAERDGLAIAYDGALAMRAIYGCLDLLVLDGPEGMAGGEEGWLRRLDDYTFLLTSMRHCAPRPEANLAILSRSVQLAEGAFRAACAPPPALPPTPPR